MSEYSTGWDKGYTSGILVATTRNRIDAFAALRRAARDARDLDRRAQLQWSIGNANRAAADHYVAAGIRVGIRIAIRTDTP